MEIGLHSPEIKRQSSQKIQDLTLCILRLLDRRWKSEDYMLMHWQIAILRFQQHGFSLCFHDFVYVSAFRVPYFPTTCHYLSLAHGDSNASRT
jgi:hypothetical protein